MNPKYRLFLIALLPAILIAALTTFVLTYRPPPEDPKAFPGRPLAAYDELYPIRTTDTGALVMDLKIFAKAVVHFSNHRDLRAIADLIYLGNANNVTLSLEPAVRERYARLGDSHMFQLLAEDTYQRERLLRPYADIVNGVGQTFAGTPIEIVLHNTRNPLKSIVAVQNPISGRRIGDPNTNFGIQLIKAYSQSGGHHDSFVGYGLTLKDGRAVKSTTIPLWDKTYGLIGFICINIDISKFNAKDPAALAQFVDNFRAITENAEISEMIQNSRRKN